MSMTPDLFGVRRVDLGSARASRGGDGAPAIANFPPPEHCGEAPQ